MNFSKRENISTKERFISEGYTDAATSEIYWRKISDREYDSVPNIYKSKLRLFMQAPGIALIIEIIVFICAIPSVISGIVRHEELAWFGLFLYIILMLLFGSLTIISLLDKLDRIVTRDSLVNAGEVSEIKTVRASRSDENVAAFHTIAVPCFGKLITIMDRPSVYAPSTVLIVRSPSMKYHLIPIPRSAADLTYAAQDLRDEMDCELDLIDIDYENYTKVGAYGIMAEVNPLSDLEFSEIPKKYRRSNIFANKPVGIIWVIITSAAIALILWIIQLYKTQSDMFIPITGGTLLAFFLEWLITRLALDEGRAINKETGFSFDCLPVNKISAEGLHYITAIVPEKKLFIEQIPVSADVYDRIPLKIPVRLYFSARFSKAVHFRTETIQ